LASAGLPCIVGEFGINNGGGGANVSQLVNYARTKGWTVLAWAWNGDGTGMDMVEPPWASNGQASNFNLSSSLMLFIHYCDMFLRIKLNSYGTDPTTNFLTAEIILCSNNIH
jgi:hypothetical protein